MDTSRKIGRRDGQPEPIDGAWKIVDIEVLEKRRIGPYGHGQSNIRPSTLREVTHNFRVQERGEKREYFCSI